MNIEWINVPTKDIHVLIHGTGGAGRIFAEEIKNFEMR